jgi:hypothetical protein
MVSLITAYCSAIYPLSRKLSELNIEKSAMQTFSNTEWIILVVFNILINFPLNFLQSS